MATRQFSLLILASALSAEACNGHASFCQLPFSKFTFPGSHNAGSFDLNIPQQMQDQIEAIDLSHLLGCFFNTHSMNYLEQLNFGMRWFWPDVCTRRSGLDNTLYDCHSGSGVDESALAWGNIFGDNLDVMKDWLSLHLRELLVVAPDNMHYEGPDREKAWVDPFEERFGTCYIIDNVTQPEDLPTPVSTGCVRIAGRPNNNITMGALIDRDLRVVVYPEGWRDMIHSTYGEENSGAMPRDLLKVFQSYGNGQVALAPQSLLSFQVLGAARVPDYSEVVAVASGGSIFDPFTTGNNAVQAIKQTDVRCVEEMAEKHNTELLQDDSNPYRYFTEKECPDSPCGCLGYKSPIEPIHQKVLDLGHSIIVVNNDYSDHGDKSHIADVVRRMNFANLRRWALEPEPVRTWWDCKWPIMVGILVPLTLFACGLCYGLLICAYPERYGLWIRKAWERHQTARALNRVGREQGREEAMAYLRSAQGGASPEANPVMMGMTSVAPPPAVANNGNSGFYQAKETE
mmetsp:Transcript_16876/g.20727  ORF Transcript_16876/g.20727 Transcript_16876/m.20727 type:complete len:515 (-) Transcript_16876:145-1689(-)